MIVAGIGYWVVGFGTSILLGFRFGWAGVGIWGGAGGGTRLRIGGAGMALEPARRTWPAARPRLTPVSRKIVPATVDDAPGRPHMRRAGHSPWMSAKTRFHS